MNFRRCLHFAILAVAGLFLTAMGCANGGSIDSGADGVTSGGFSSGAGPGGSICLLHNCNSDLDCGACDSGRNTCLVADHRCVACGGMSGSCPEGQTCSSYGQCVPVGASCPTDSHGTPQISCNTNADCVACDPMHQVCDTSSHKCVSCTPNDTSACQSTEQCVAGACSPKCPKSCIADNDCSNCGGPGHEAHACNVHKCAECSPTHQCPNGEVCSPEGVCIKECGANNSGVCTTDADCAGCGGSATTCHAPINGGNGKCGVAANGCSDLGQGTIVLPSPFDKVTNTCSGDSDCANVGIQYNVGKLLRDFTGVSQIKDANIDYGMHVCASISVGSGEAAISCGICVPCKVDSDCTPIDVDQIAGQAFGPIGSIAASLLLDQVFGNNEHKIFMFCQQVAAGYGVCAPCPGLLNDCAVGGGGGGGGGSGSCDHDVCTSGGALKMDCDACTQSLCAVDSYCCDTAWDSTCVGEVDQYCGQTCAGSGSSGSGGGGSCAHDECSAGDKLDKGCSSCAAALCASDSYCCDTAWDSTCVNEVAQYCGYSCGGGSSGSGGGGCAHDECTAGAALDANCSSCASALCASDSYCCATAWDANCVGEVGMYCGAACP